MNTELEDTAEVSLLQRRTLRTLMAGLVPAGAATTSAYSAAAVLGEELTDSETLGGLAAASATIGSAFAFFGLSFMLHQRDRELRRRTEEWDRSSAS